MASLAEIVRSRSSLSLAEVVHLQRLVATWNMLADFCFSDLLLYVPLGPKPGGSADDVEFVVVGHVRPSTTQTLYRHDMIGEQLDEFAYDLALFVVHEAASVVRLAAKSLTRSMIGSMAGALWLSMTMVPSR